MNGVTITYEELHTLIENSMVADTLRDALVQSATLTYDKCRLDFDWQMLDTIMKVVLPETYRSTLARLQAEDKAKQAEKEAQDK